MISIIHPSQGAILTRNALATYDPEKRKRIHVIAVAPAAYIDEDLCGSIVHFVSKGDFIPLLDFQGRRRNLHTTAYLDRHENANFFDHGFQSQTYEQPIMSRIEQILIDEGRL